MPGPNGDTQEDDGVLLGMVFDGESVRTSLVVSACSTHLVHVTACRAQVAVVSDNRREK